MVSVWHDFDLKAKEVDTYIRFLQNFENSGEDPSGDLLKILRANSFLMLYNLIESTVRNALEEIHNSLNMENLRFEHCIDEIKAIWVEFHYKKFKEKSSINIIYNLKNLQNDIISVAYNEYLKVKSNDVSGSVDRRKIELLAEKYKFQKNLRVSGEKLHIVKTNRNSLAHGEASFADVGKNYTTNDLIVVKKTCVLYLKEMLTNIEKYILDKKFRVS